MAEFSYVIKEFRRMCDTYNNTCHGCPLEFDAQCEDFLNCGNISLFESVILKWSAEHPEPQYPTWEEYQRENFPDSCKWICRRAFMSVPEAQCDDMTCEECIKQSIPADVAEKLGIKPKEV